MNLTRRKALLSVVYLLGRVMYGAPEADASTGWTNITNATKGSFTPGPFFAGKRVRCVVAAHNPGGKASVPTPGTNPVKS